MHLPKNGREFYRLEIVTSPPTLPSQWEASFDGGGTWVAAQDQEGLSVWLMAGPDYAPIDGIPTVRLTDDVTPRVRLIDAPEVVVRRAPGIWLRTP